MTSEMLASEAAAKSSRPLISNVDDLMFGRAPKPVRCGLGIEIGAGHVYPELNFTLPPMSVTKDTWPEVVQIYDSVVTEVLTRSRQLQLSGLVIEFEQLPPMTAVPEWGAELTRRMKEKLTAAHEEWKLASALRVTVVDLRDQTHPPLRRKGAAWEQMRAAFEQCAVAGADILSIESTGGKEIHDNALTHADVPGIVFALGVLAPRDMAWLWDQIVGISKQHNVVAGGDSACGFANTAMQLAGRNMLPDVLAALVRALSTVRSLVAFERGAVGPSKDCAYEGPVMKAIAGVPIAMEGRSATCAHLSPIGNIAIAAADLWSNESVQDTPLLSGRAPIASLESLVYDCRLLNASFARGSELELRDLHVASDAPLTAQAFVLTPECTLALANAICSAKGDYARTLAAGRVALDEIAKGAKEGTLTLPVRETRWLDRLRTAFDALPKSEEELTAALPARYKEAYTPAEYGL